MQSSRIGAHPPHGAAGAAGQKPAEESGGLLGGLTSGLTGGVTGALGNLTGAAGGAAGGLLSTGKGLFKKFGF